MADVRLDILINADECRVASRHPTKRLTWDIELAPDSHHLEDKHVKQS